MERRVGKAERESAADAGSELGDEKVSVEEDAWTVMEMGLNAGIAGITIRQTGTASCKQTTGGKQICAMRTKCRGDGCF